MKPDIFSRVNAPPTCRLNWDHVDPGQKQWFCSHCGHHVHNLSAMTRREAKQLTRSAPPGRLCVSFVRDENGRAIFRKARPWFGSIGAAVLRLASAAILLLISGCATVQQPCDKPATTAESKTRPEPGRWTGF